MQGVGQALVAAGLQPGIFAFNYTRQQTRTTPLRAFRATIVPFVGAPLAAPAVI